MSAPTIPTAQVDPWALLDQPATPFPVMQSVLDEIPSSEYAPDGFFPSVIVTPF